MGNNAIIIRTVGCHHNNSSGDAERLGARFVDELRANGHTVLSATCETGGASIELAQKDDMGRSPAGIPPVTDPETPGRMAYERYLSESKGKSLVSGAELPGWDALAPEIKQAWMAAVDHTHPRLAR